MKKDYSCWHALKSDIQSQRKVLYFKERDIFWVHLGQNVGHEQDGIGDLYTRPVVVVRKINKNTALVVPLTTKVKKGTYFHEFVSSKGKQNTAILSQLRMIDKKRFLRSFGMIGLEDHKIIKEKIRENLFSDSVFPRQVGGDPEGQKSSEEEQGQYIQKPIAESNLFQRGRIWAYPTDTSFGLGVRADDAQTLKEMYDLKKRAGGKFFSLMVRDENMLKEFAILPSVPNGFEDWDEWFSHKPRTAILKPSPKLPKSMFWPEEKVAFRICTIPEIGEQIDYPVTATSANLSGEQNMYSVEKLRKKFGDSIEYYDLIPELPVIPPSEIWDFTGTSVVQIR